MKAQQHHYFVTPASLFLLLLGLLAMGLFLLFALVLHWQISAHQTQMDMQQKLVRQVSTLQLALDRQTEFTHLRQSVQQSLGRWLNYQPDKPFILTEARHDKKRITRSWQKINSALIAYAKEQKNLSQQIAQIQDNIDYVSAKGGATLTASLWQLERWLWHLKARRWRTQTTFAGVSNRPMLSEVRGLLRALKSLSSQIEKTLKERDHLAAQLFAMQQQINAAISTGQQQQQQLRILGQFNYLLVLLTLLCWLASLGVLGLHQRRQKTQRTIQLDEQSQALTQLQSELEQLLSGQLALEFSQAHELTRPLSAKLNAAIAHLRDFMHTNQENVQQHAQAIQRILQNTQHLQQAMTFYLQKAQQSSQSMQAFNEFTAHNKNNSKDLFQASKRSALICQKTISEVRASYIGLLHIQEQVEENRRRVKRLGESSQEIADVLNVINEMGEQTNVLAINAAIQSSQAGEAGKGFSVVAEEIQRLAEKSTLMIEQIERLVSAIQTDSKEVGIALEKTIGIVAKTTAQADDANVAMEDFNSSLKLLSNLSQSLLNTDNLHSQNLPKLMDIQNLFLELAQQAQSGVAQIQATSSDLNVQNDALSRSFKQFKLDD